MIGGGAAGFFAAVAAARAAEAVQVVLFEATAHPLAKVRISGGGRCNVTHACFDPRELIKRYPRGSRELLGPFHRFGPNETIEWFARHGVTLKTEADGRVFPATDDSATIVNCLCRQAASCGVELRTRCGVRNVRQAAAIDPPAGNLSFVLETTEGTVEEFDRVVVATGGNRGSTGLAIAAAFGHSIAPPVPSLFTFHLDDPRLQGLEGVSVSAAELSVPGTRLREAGAMLVTHWGLSGPAVLRLSAWGARELASREYRFPLRVAWVGSRRLEHAAADLERLRGAHPRRQTNNINPWELPARLWERLLAAAGVARDAPWTTISNAALQVLAREAVAADYVVTGKSMNKEEFVTCGGVQLSQVDFRRMESRLCRGLFFAGEVLDIDGITGGFNFQAAWTTGWIAGHAAASDG